MLKGTVLTSQGLSIGFPQVLHFSSTPMMCTFTYGNDFSLINSKKNGKYKCKITKKF